MKIFKTLFWLLLSLVGIFFAWCFGVAAGASHALDDPEWGKAEKMNWDSLSPSLGNKSEKRSKRQKYATLNEVLRGRDEFYEEIE